MKEKKYFLKAWLVNEINYTWRHWAEVWEQRGLGARSYSSDYVDLFTSDFLPNIAQKRCLNFLKCRTLLEGESSSYDQITGLYTNWPYTVLSRSVSLTCSTLSTSPAPSSFSPCYTQPRRKAAAWPEFWEPCEGPLTTSSPLLSFSVTQR